MNSLPWKPLTRLIVTPCHGVYLQGPPYLDASWKVLDYQSGNACYWVEHLWYSVDLAYRDEESLLVFSGGMTRDGVGPISESQSYWSVADNQNWWSRISIRQRCVVEIFSMDSFQNLLFSICRFRECVGRYPEQIDVVGWEFKSDRFHDHAQALRYPLDRFVYHGINNPPPYKLEQAQAGEDAVRAAFKEDPYGTGEELAAKRASRNPWSMRPPYELSCPEIFKLLQHESGELFAGKLPWDALSAKTQDSKHIAF